MAPNLSKNDLVTCQGAGSNTSSLLIACLRGDELENKGFVVAALSVLLGSGSFKAVSYFTLGFNVKILIVLGFMVTVYSLQFTVYRLQFTVYRLQFTVYSLQFTVYSFPQVC